MNPIYTERLINRTRYIMALFILISGISAWKNGSAPAVYYYIIGGGFIHLSVALVNQWFIFKKRIPLILIYCSVTVEVANLVMAKIAFHWDAFNGWGLTVKEQATFMMFILYVVIHALRFNKWLNIYMGFITISGYILLIVMGITLGDMYFTRESHLIFAANALRAPTEVAKILFMAGNAYFMYLMGDFTMKFISTIQEDRKKSEDNLATTNRLLTSVHDMATRLSSSMAEMSATTMSLADNTNMQTNMEHQIVEASGKSVTSIESLARNANRQCESFMSLSERVSELSHSIETLSGQTGQAIELIKSITRKTSDGRDALKNTNEVMISIEKTSNEMTSIMEMINDISDQINLLSLNAGHRIGPRGGKRPRFRRRRRRDLEAGGQDGGQHRRNRRSSSGTAAPR